MHSSSEGPCLKWFFLCRLAGRISSIFRNLSLYRHPVRGGLQPIQNGECETLWKGVIVETSCAQLIMHETSGQQTSGRVIAQQCTGMQSVHARTVFLVKEGYSIGMEANLQDRHPYNLSSLIHLTLQQCFYTNIVLFAMQRFSYFIAELVMTQ